MTQVVRFDTRVLCIYPSTPSTRRSKGAHTFGNSAYSMGGTYPSRTMAKTTPLSVRVSQSIYTTILLRGTRVPTRVQLWPKQQGLVPGYLKLSIPHWVHPWRVNFAPKRYPKTIPSHHTSHSNPKPCNQTIAVQKRKLSAEKIPRKNSAWLFQRNCPRKKTNCNKNRYPRTSIFRDFDSTQQHKGGMARRGVCDARMKNPAKEKKLNKIKTNKNTEKSKNKIKVEDVAQGIWQTRKP